MMIFLIETAMVNGASTVDIYIQINITQRVLSYHLIEGHQELLVISVQYQFLMQIIYPNRTNADRS